MNNIELDSQEKFKLSTNSDDWEQLKNYTDARIALGRAGCSIPTKPLLEFQLSHAQARDAVFQSLDTKHLQGLLKEKKSIVLLYKALLKIKRFF